MFYLIQDPRGNVLRQWLAVDGVLGVVSQEFQLSENPPLGQWTIVTTVSVSLLHLIQSIKCVTDRALIRIGTHLRWIKDMCLLYFVAKFFNLIYQDFKVEDQIKFLIGIFRVFDNK